MAGSTQSKTISWMAPICRSPLSFDISLTGNCGKTGAGLPIGAGPLCLLAPGTVQQGREWRQVGHGCLGQGLGRAPGLRRLRCAMARHLAVMVDRQGALKLIFRHE